MTLRRRIAKALELGDLTAEQLALMLSTGPWTIRSELREMRQEGIVEYARGRKANGSLDRSGVFHLAGRAHQGPLVITSKHEFVQCQACIDRGYGIDSWLPASSEFWPVTRAGLSFKTCRACLADTQRNRKGVVPEKEAA